MRYLIVGSGQAGGLIGSRLIERGADVTFLVRPERKVRLLTTGLMLTSPFGRFRRPVAAITVGQLATVYDVVVLATRAQDYEAALSLVRTAIGPETSALVELGRRSPARRTRGHSALPVSISVTI